MTNKPKSFGVHLKCRSISKSLMFYRALGFTPVFAYGSQEFTSQFSFPTAPEKYQGVSLAIGDAILEIADGHVAVKQEVFKEIVQSSKISMFFDIDSISDFLRVCEEANIEIIVNPKVYPWGTKEVVVKDPDGAILVFREKIS